MGRVFETHHGFAGASGSRGLDPPYNYSLLPILAQHFASPGRHGGPPGGAAYARGQRADAAVGQANLDAAGVSRRGPGRIAVALPGLDLKF